MQTQSFDAFKTTLHLGTNLIEASAGTGKTYTIAVLALRFIVEQNVNITELLVVTFTKAATEELKDRIRLRLLEAKQVFIHQSGDPQLTVWLQSLNVPALEIERRIDNALLAIDQAPIFTIHGFCQRILQEYPLQSGQAFNTTLFEDISQLQRQCADDFWRRTIYPLTPWQAAVLTAEYHTPDALLASVKSIPATIIVYPTVEPLAQRFIQLNHAVNQSKQIIDELALKLQTCFADGAFKESYVQTFADQVKILKDWLTQDNPCFPDEKNLALLSLQGLFEGLNGQKFRKTKQQSGEARKQQYLDSLNLNTEPFDQLLNAVKKSQLSLRLLFLQNLHTATALELQHHHALSFDQLIIKLAGALTNSTALVFAVQNQFKAALIDEFQDTDDQQWSIFSKIFAIPTHYLYLIGDPKQAIYKFRGADIYSYLAAQQSAQYGYTLSHNWRSHPSVVKGINILFQRSNPFAFEALNFFPVQAGQKHEQGYIKQNHQVVAPMVCWQLPLSSKNAGYWTSGDADKIIRNNIVNEMMSLLTDNYILKTTTQERSLNPQDIAILVRSNRQAREYQQALRKANIPSVLHSMESVFASQEAFDLYILLRAISEPGQGVYFNQALTSDWFGFNGQRFYQFMNDAIAVDNAMARFDQYYQLWQKSGLMTMMLQLIATEKVRENLAKTVLAERQLTNIQHLLELLQQAIIDEKLSIEETLTWLQTAIQQASNNEYQQLRLESDDHAVKIVTIHRSKGLEYNVVFCPFLWQTNQQEKSVVICHENGCMVADLGSEDFNHRTRQAQQEELAEELRLLYVAVTRAKYRCYVVWADVRTKETPNQSALAWLMEFAELDFIQQQNKWQQLSDDAPGIFSYRLLAGVEFTDCYKKQKAIVPLSVLTPQRNLYSAWQMSSYTALSALTVKEIVLDDKLSEQPDHQQLVDTLLPKGAALGNVVHTLLERHSFAQLTQPEHFAEQRQALCLRYGLILPQPELLDTLLYHTVTGALSDNDPDFCLMHLTDQFCLKEMPFYLALSPLQTQRINAILQDCPTFQPLDKKSLEGYLTGFIDLVCCYQGRYYVIDYKTNLLPDYEHNALLQAMREHNYGLQYWIYTLVLHRYLQLRLPNYDFDQHFGGVRYLFVRGMNNNIPMQGVFADRPSFATLNTLNGLFTNGT